MPATATALTLREARRFLGVAVRRPEVRGLRLRGAVDDLVEGLERVRGPEGLGWDVMHGPIENGPPGSVYFGTIRTSGSPWLDVFEPDDMGLLSDDLAADLSRACDTAVLCFNYRFEGGRLCHRLYEHGEHRDDLDLAADEEALVRLNGCYRRWRMRDWGITLDDLIARSMPFAPSAIVEAFFLRLECRAAGDRTPGRAEAPHCETPPAPKSRHKEESI